MNIYIIRNNQRFGPYTEQALLSYVNQGVILLSDKAVVEGTTEEHTVRSTLKQANLKPKITSNGNIFSQIKDIGVDLIFPRAEMFSKAFLKDRRFLLLAIVGFLPMLIMYLPVGGVLLFYAVSLYFAVIWGLFFYAFFKTWQVRWKTAAMVFSLTQVMIFVFWDMLGLPNLNPFYTFIDAAFPINIIGFIPGVGLTEELVKLLPLVVILRRAKEPLIPQTVVFYGLMSGIAFGVYEGVQYQMTVNAQQSYDVSFFLNIMRLTSLPFLHACWCGIAGYFLSFAHLYPQYRYGLYTLALCIPAVVHGLYDSLSSTWGVSLIMVFIGLMLLMAYLKRGEKLQSNLRQ